MAESRLPVVASRPAFPRVRDAARGIYRERGLHPAVQALAATAAEFSPELLRFARRAWDAKRRLRQQHEAHAMFSEAEFTYTEVHVRVATPARRVVVHQTSTWSMPVLEASPRGSAARQIGLGLAGVAGALLMYRILTRWEWARLPSLRRLAE